MRQELNRRRAARIQHAFNISKRSNKAKEINPTMLSNKFRKAVSKLPKANASIWTQMQTGHVATRAYLYKFKLAESPTCRQQCGTGEKTVTHYFRHCKKYKTQRRELYTKLGGKPKAIEFLRTGKHMKWVFQYIRDTARFEESHGRIKVPGEEEKEGQSITTNEGGEEEEEWI